ncbi:putative nuclease HARBI1 [Diadema setosum]|uniref:putative nuclease HARBI1 n=1 Tax=Diadema setosum TaxID=31175 RepID=UPI003B3AC971
MAAFLLLGFREQEAARRNFRRQRVFRDRLNPLDHYDDSEMLKNYRFSREGVLRIIDIVKDDLQKPTNRSHALDPSIQVLCALGYYAKGELMSDRAEIHHVSIPTVSQTVKAVTQALIRKKDERPANDITSVVWRRCVLYYACGRRRTKYIRFPTTPLEVRQSQEDFFGVAGFPKITGIIDCTHVTLRGCHLLEAEHHYVNRKKQHSINVQLVCTSDYKISNVVARWPGGAHDSRILCNSRLARGFTSGILQGVLLGDLGYPQLPWLMTPYLDTQGIPARESYSRAHKKTRVRIEQLNGQLKNKFQCLHGLSYQTPERCSEIIVACCILFNLSKIFNEPADVEDHIEVDRVEAQGYDGDVHLEGVAARDDIVNNLFV